MKILIDVVKFGFAIFVIYYLPGYFFIRTLKKEFELWEKIIVSFCTGLFIIPQLYSYLEGITLHNFFLICVMVSSLIYSGCKLSLSLFYKIKARWCTFNLKLNWEKVFLCGITLIVLAFASSVIGTSGIVYSDGLRFYNANAFDSTNQLAIVSELTKNPPHEFPFYSGLSLKGYHVGAFYWRAIVQKAAKIDPLDLFFRFCPLFLFPLIVLMIFLSIKNVMGDNHVALMATFFMFLMSGLSWVFPIIDRLLPCKDIQTVNLGGDFLEWFMFNPPLAHGVLIFFMGCYFLKESHIAGGRQKVWPTMLLAGFLFGSLYEYKSFMWAVALPSLILVGVKEYFFDKKSLFLKIGLIAILFSIFSFLRSPSSQQVPSLFRFEVGYYPLSIFKEIGIIDLAGQVSFLVILAAFLFYLIGILGIKIIGFIKIYQYFKKWRKISSIALFLIFSMGFSFIFTHTLLLNTKYFYATSNFFAIFLIVICIFASEAVNNWVKKTRFFSKAIVFLTLFVIGIGSTTFSFLGYFPKYSKYKIIPKSVLAAVDYIKENSKQDAVILHNLTPEDWIAQKNHKRLTEGIEGRDSFISALTQRRVVCECSWHIEAVHCLDDLNQRQKNIQLFFDTEDKSTAVHILDQYEVDYVWLEEGQRLHFEKEHILEMVFSNSQVQIYKRIHM